MHICFGSTNSEFVMIVHSGAVLVTIYNENVCCLLVISS